MKTAIVICLLVLITPVLAFASDEAPATIPWSMIITTILVILTGVAGGIIGAMRKALVASHEALKIISDALEDQTISDDEIKAIVKSAVNCQQSYKDLVERFKELFKKSAKV